jgi:hypothetical protein
MYLSAPWTPAAYVDSPCVAPCDRHVRIVHDAAGVYAPDVRGGIPSAIAATIRACSAYAIDSTVVTCRQSGLGGDLVVDGTRVRRASSLGCVSSVPVAPGWPLLF